MLWKNLETGIFNANSLSWKRSDHSRIHPVSDHHCWWFNSRIKTGFFCSWDSSESDFWLSFWSDLSVSFCIISYHIEASHILCHAMSYLFICYYLSQRIFETLWFLVQVFLPRGWFLIYLQLLFLPILCWFHSQLVISYSLFQQPKITLSTVYLFMHVYYKEPLDKSEGGAWKSWLKTKY